MRGMSRYVVVLIVLAMLAVPMATLADTSLKDVSLNLTPAVTVENDQIRIMMSDEGVAVVSTTNGDPDFVGDEEKRLLFAGGSTSASNTGSPTIRVTQAGATTDYYLFEQTVSVAPRVDGQAVVAEWQFGDAHVTHRVSLTQNPFTGREDLARFSMTVNNTGNETIEAGVRLLLDLMIGDNDYAPVLVPDLGQLNVETDLTGATHYRAFEDSDFAADSLRALGVVSGYGLTAPDRVILARWPYIESEAWDYAITSGTSVGDSAVAYYWNPVSLSPGASVTVETLYGLGSGGGDSWFDAPTSVTCDSGAFSATLWVANRGFDEMTGGQTILNLPAGLSLASGDTTFAFPNVPGDDVASVTLNLVADTSAPANLTYSANTTFDGVSAMVAEASVTVPDCSSDPTPTPTETPTEVPEPGSLTLLALGIGGLAAAWKRRKAR